METPSKIKAKLVGPNALVVVLALLGMHFAKKYQIEIGTDTIMLLAGAAVTAWTSSHVNKTAALIDVLANSGPMTVKEGKALTAIATEVQSTAFPGKIDEQTVALAKDVAAAREFSPQVTVQEVLERTQNR